MTKNKQNNINKNMGAKEVIKHYLGKSKKLKSSLFLLAFGRIMVCFVRAMPLIYYKQLVETISNYSGGEIDQTYASLIAIIIGILFFNILNFIGWRIVDSGLYNYIFPLFKKLMTESFEYVQNHSYKFFSNTFVGELTKKMNKYVFSFRGLFSVLFFDIIPLIIDSSILLFIVGRYNLKLMGIFFLWYILFSSLQYFFFKKKYPLDKEVQKAESKLSGILADTISNNLNLKIFSSLNYELDNYSKSIDERQKLDKKKFRLHILIASISGILLILIESLIIWLAIYLWKTNILSVGVIVLLQLYVRNIVGYLWNLGNVFKNFHKAVSETSQLIEILNIPHEINDIENAKDLKVNSGQIDLKNMSFSYLTDKRVFDKLNISIKPGEKIAFVGASGAGKSTIIKLLLRFYEINEGSIEIDGQDISKVTQNSLRNNISFVPQEPVLFHRSILENIKYGNQKATQEEINLACMKANCLDFIKNLNSGFETLVGERGIKLSGGERQRVAIARAILENKKILILDEATSALDSQSEKLIQEAMDEVMKNKTTIVIAHRLSTIMKMDRIIVLDQGKIAETGNHRELLEKGGIYKKLWDIQSGGFIE